jgi:DNA (cytosine-5)-methyltransferase 1
VQRCLRPDGAGVALTIVGGFPCQSVSVAGDGAGLNDKSKSGLFFDFAKLIGEMAPSLAILENVVGLASHDNGKTFGAVMNALADLGYSVSTRLLDSSDFGVPQKRERLFLVCIHDSVLANRTAPFTFPKRGDAAKVVADILEPVSKGRRCHRPLVRLKKEPAAKSHRIETVGLIDGMNNQGYRVASPLGKGFTLCASSGGVGGKTGLYLVKGKPRVKPSRVRADARLSRMVRASLKSRRGPQTVWKFCRCARGRSVGEATPPIFKLGLINEQSRMLV